MRKRMHGWLGCLRLWCCVSSRTISWSLLQICFKASFVLRGQGVWAKVAGIGNDDVILTAPLSAHPKNCCCTHALDSICAHTVTTVEQCIRGKSQLTHRKHLDAQNGDQVRIDSEVFREVFAHAPRTAIGHLHLDDHYSYQMLWSVKYETQTVNAYPASCSPQS